MFLYKILHLLLHLLYYRIYYTWINIKSSYNKDTFKISALTGNDELELPDGSYLMPDIPDYVQYIKKNVEKILIIHQYEYVKIR